MAQMDRKAKLEGLVRQLHNQRGSHDVAAMVEMLQLRLEGVKNNLLTCKTEEFFRLQGEAQAYDKVIRDILRPSPTQKLAEEK